MPELPEVEVTRRHLAEAVTGRVITAAEVRRPRMVRRHARPGDFADRVVGRTVEHVGRHGKFLLGRLSGDVTWVTHLGMSGRVSLAAAGDEEAPHTNVVVRFDDAAEFRLVDPRTFGFVAAWLPDEMAAASVAALGPDALDDLPPAAALAARMARRMVAIKPLLLDQRFVAGLGNIYADEVLHRAGIRPSRPAGSLSGDEVARLRRSIGPVLAAGLRHGGTSLGDLAYLLPDGRAGEFLSRLAVYGREDEPCRRCGTPVVRSVLRQRSAFWCPECQS
jgi:formamidopyrimidine-DNA glycosylase